MMRSAPTVPLPPLPEWIVEFVNAVVDDLNDAHPGRSHIPLDEVKERLTEALRNRILDPDRSPAGLVVR